LRRASKRGHDDAGGRFFPLVGGNGHRRRAIPNDPWKANSLFGAKNSLFHAEQGIGRNALPSRSESRWSLTKQAEIGGKIQEFPVKFAVLRELARRPDSNAFVIPGRGLPERLSKDAREPGIHTHKSE
jgi:hypothetical protein